MKYTLSDIASRAKVSTVTVHKALHGKAGISEETRQRILEIVKEMDYTINPMASSLKRETLRIAIIYPELPKEANYFFSQIKEGINAAEKKLADFNTILERHPCSDAWEDQATILEQLAKDSQCDGIVIYCLNDRELSPMFALLETKGIPVVTFHSDAIESCRIASVTANDELTGRLAAEFLIQLIPGAGHILLLSGNTMQKVLRDNAHGFCSYIQQARQDLQTIEISNFLSMEKLADTVTKVMKAFPDLQGVYCTNARNSITLCQFLDTQNIKGLKIVTSDVFPELYPYIEKNLIQGTIWQDPVHQAYDAVMLLFEHITAHPFITGTTSFVKSCIVQKNNFEQFLPQYQIPSLH